MSKLRSLERARDMLHDEGVTDRHAGAYDDADEEVLGCSLAAQRQWLREVSATELRLWARDWVRSFAEEKST